MWAADSPGPHRNRQEVRLDVLAVAVDTDLSGNQTHISERRATSRVSIGPSDRHAPLNLQMCARHANCDRS